ncbi:hypothetical protein E2562_004892 [Oryza meyeriana var. granulata]|uniref:Stress enhanced protein 1 n=1 Tax=Oryza meyeriana var. granulata TaxID=110450 RepID=A0A6G1C358_9ORYZ|nr:hypothetical protein E2562_004892 [Oryza meyeriana var. granulata]
MALSSVVLRPSPFSSPATAAASSPRRYASVLRATSSKRRALASRAATSLSVRCEQTAKQGSGGGGGSGAGLWLGRLAMVSFTTAVVVEVSTGKGVVANLGVATPAPTLALVVTSLAAGLAVYFIFQAGSRD